MTSIRLPDSPRILVSRTDKIGDLVLSTPVFSALRKRFPKSFLAALVFKETESLVRGNPFLDEVVVYDKKEVHKNWFRTTFFGLNLRKYSFDAVIHLHPTHRVNFISYFARIPIRIGYDVKSSFLLTHTIAEEKWQGRKHEAEYNFDLLRLIDVPQPEVLELIVPLSAKGEVEFRNISLPERYAVYHPSASDSSKVWPPERLGRVASELYEQDGLFPVIVGSKTSEPDAQTMLSLMKTKPLDLSGKLSLEGLAFLIKKASILISNDSGPVHIAAALGTPVLSIFGRNQAGLGTTRWRPISPRSFFLQQEVGCIECLAHNCQIGFKCLMELTVEEVLKEAKELLSNSKEVISSLLYSREPQMMISFERKKNH